MSDTELKELEKTLTRGTTRGMGMKERLTNESRRG